MDLKSFDFLQGAWLDISGQPGASIEYDEASGWVTSPGYKKYVAQITQSSTNAPTAIVLENTLGFVPDWEYSGGGVYGFDWDVDFNPDRCAVYLSPALAGKLIWIAYNDSYDITLISQDGNGIVNQTTFEIRYYN